MTGHPAVRIADRTYAAGECLRKRWAAAFYASEVDEAEPLYKTGSNYTTRAEYPLTRNKTVADGGAPGPHPYLEGERIPAYVGAVGNQKTTIGSIRCWISPTWGRLSTCSGSL